MAIAFTSRSRGRASFPFTKLTPGRAAQGEDRMLEAPLTPRTPCTAGGEEGGPVLPPCLPGSTPEPAFSSDSIIPTLLVPPHSTHFPIFSSSLVTHTHTSSHAPSSSGSPTLSQVQTLNSLWVDLPLGKSEEGPGPESHNGCLDGLRSLFEGPPCPYPGTLIPFQVPGTSHPSPASHQEISVWRFNTWQSGIRN